MLTRTSRLSSSRRAACALAAFAAIAAHAIGCESTRVETRTVTMHAPAACAPGPTSYATLLATGDFQPQAPGATVFLDQIGASIANMPATSRALSAAVIADQVGALRWNGLAPVPETGGVHLLVWPSSYSCPLSQPTPPLPDRVDAAIGAIGATRVLVAGGTAAGAAAAPSFFADLTTGAVSPIAVDLTVPRARATVTPYGEGALVAGGVRPGGDDPLESAEVFSADAFESAPILLSEPRASHAAVVLATGETLLVGGLGLHGPLASLDLVDPATRRARGGLARLEIARTRPVALRLASGEILVAGGFDANGQPVALLEWLSRDGMAHSKRSRQLVASAERAFVALPGGGALAVISPPDASPGFRNVWVISADGDLEGAAPLAVPLARPRLFRGTAGAPVLWTGDQWLRWQPWAGAFAPTGVDPSNGPDLGAIASPDDGLALWLGASGGHAALYGLRFDVRGPFSTDATRSPLLVDGPALMAPDRLIDGTAAAPITFTAGEGLVLSPGASAFLSDATFAAFALDVKLGAVAPLVVLRDATGAELEVGGPTCPLVVPDHAPSLHVERRGPRVSVRIADGEERDCVGSVAADARLSIGLRGRGDRPSVGASLVIMRP